MTMRWDEETPFGPDYEGDHRDANFDACGDCQEEYAHQECDDCGAPLCYKCHELGAGFCKACPSPTYGQRVGLA